MDQQRSASQKLPAGLAGVLNMPEEHRDSAYYSGTDASSKHTSAASGLGVLSPPVSGFQTSPIDKTPSPTSTNLLPQPLVSPVTSSMSVSAMVSPTTPNSADPRRYDRPQSIESAPRSATFLDGPESLSRRESVDSSRLNQGLTDMRLGNSPYTSQNHSTTSIHNAHNALLQQRNPRGFDLSGHRISNGYQPSAERNPEGQNKASRIAPAITGPATSQIARAAEPTKGQAWAFPEEDIKQIPLGALHGINDSRRSSIAESLASSQYTTESRLPPGQRRLDDSMEYQQQRLSNASTEFSTVHHHTLQHKQLGELQSEELGSHGGSQPYSRTPELRVSHKLAERKRRTEMKELFEQLRDLMPQERGSKASKWEILTKAIAEHGRQADHIRRLEHMLQGIQAENERLKHELAVQGHRGGPPPPGMYQPDPYGRSRTEELPPLRTLQPGAAPDSMLGIQYEQQSRVAGFRPQEQGPQGPSRF
ncbi:hypothetical protein QBC34DRAFT_57282 [Podospora aff. communis PSN243]|uniref:BHLH domain-containing protein n=1 Tax=Podospora aff. communis PSN243 TaxID=3040156 RepID=A0AAV9GU23_9PEZI|nr:hypothetical protein QBC34DRAFT_57282 [Podospora aff. communis PSN243]